MRHLSILVVWSSFGKYGFPRNDSSWAARALSLRQLAQLKTLTIGLDDERDVWDEDRWVQALELLKGTKLQRVKVYRNPDHYKQFLARPPPDNEGMVKDFISLSMDEYDLPGPIPPLEGSNSYAQLGL